MQASLPFFLNPLESAHVSAVMGGRCVCDSTVLWDYSGRVPITFTLVLQHLSAHSILDDELMVYQWHVCAVKGTS